MNMESRIRKVERKVRQLRLGEKLRDVDDWGVRER